MKRTRSKSATVPVTAECSPCPYEMAYDVQFRKVEENLEDMRQRVRRLETVLARGVMLLIANLACVVGTLAQQLMR